MNEGQRNAADEGDDSPHQGNRSAVRWGRERARAALGLAVWEIELAVTAGLLERCADRRFDPDEVTRTAAGLDAFRAHLAREHRFNASQAARRLGVSAARFARVVAQTGLAPVAEEQVCKYGRVLTVRYYRAVDVDGLAAYAAADQVLREAVTAVGRPAAARKAAVTRARNKERAEQARHELQAVRKQTAQGAAVALVRYAAALAAGLLRGPGFLKKFVTDEAVGVLAAVVEECRMHAEERSALLDEVLPLAHKACAELTGPAEIERRSGVDPAVFAGRTDMVGGYMARAELEKVLAAPPQWLAQARAAAVAAEAEAAAHRTRTAEERAVLAAAREAARLTNETVAELFGLPADIVAALRPRGSTGLWNPQHVAALRAAPPPWLRQRGGRPRRSRAARVRCRRCPADARGPTGGPAQDLGRTAGRAAGSGAGELRQTDRQGGAGGPRQSAGLGQAVTSRGAVSACAPQGRSGAGGTDTVPDATAREGPTVSWPTTTGRREWGGDVREPSDTAPHPWQQCVRE